MCERMSPCDHECSLQHAVKQHAVVWQCVYHYFQTFISLQGKAILKAIFYDSSILMKLRLTTLSK